MKLKTQTKKKSYTLVIYNDDGYEIDRRTVEAEGPREAIRKAYENIFGGGVVSGGSRQ